MNTVTVLLAIAVVLVAAIPVAFFVVWRRDRKLRSRLPTLNHQLHGPFRGRGRR